MAGEKTCLCPENVEKGYGGKKSLLILTGDIGTGKTTLINEIIHTLDPGTAWVKIVDPCFEMDDLFGVIAQALGFEDQYCRGKNFSSEFFSFLKAAGDEDKKVRVIVDEAQRMPEWFLREVISWAQFDLNRVLTIILAGQLELENLLRKYLGQAWKDTIDGHACLEPLNEQETETYINKRLELAGTDRKIFLSSAVHEAYGYSKGFPRLINISCDQALIDAFSKGRKVVDGHAFKEVARQLSLPVALPEKKEHNEKEQPKEDRSVPDRQWRFKKKIAWTTAACLCLYIGGLFYTGYTPSAIKNETSALLKPMKSLENQIEKVIPPATIDSNKRFRQTEHTLTEPLQPIVPEKKPPAGPEIGLGYTPALSSENREDIYPVLPRDIMKDSKTANTGIEKDMDEYPTSSIVPEPDAVIDWLIEKRKLKEK